MMGAADAQQPASQRCDLRPIKVDDVAGPP
jgi:hypothetical protein